MRSFCDFIFNITHSNKYKYAIHVNELTNIHKMDVLKLLIQDLKKAEIRYFKLFSAIYEKEDRKDVKLFDLYRKSDKENTDEVFAIELYGNAEHSPFHRLKNRLLEDVNQSLWMQHFDKIPELNDLYLYGLVRLHTIFRRTNVAMHYLRRAEKQAEKNENYEIMDLIYSQFIQFSLNNTSLNPDIYIQKRLSNRAKLTMLGEIDDMLAQLTYRISTSFNIVNDKDFLAQLQQKIDFFTQQAEVSTSKKLNKKIYEVVVRILLQKNEFEMMENYLFETLQRFEGAGFFDKENHDLKLSMITYLVNALYMNKKYEKSLEYADVLNKAMQEYGGTMYDKYAFFYFNALVNNYAIIDKEKAIEILLKMKKDAKETALKKISIFINLAILYFELKKYKLAIQHINEFCISDEYKNIDIALKLKIEILEAVLHIEQHDFDWSESKLRKISKEYQMLLQSEGHFIDKRFLVLLAEINKKWEKNEPIAQICAAFLQETQSLTANFPILNYIDWASRYV